MNSAAIGKIPTHTGLNSDRGPPSSDPGVGDSRALVRADGAVSLVCQRRCVGLPLCSLAPPPIKGAGDRGFHPLSQIFLQTLK
jgi:hypothetical protein